MDLYWGLRCKTCGRQSDLGAKQWDETDRPAQFLSKVAALAPLIQQIIHHPASDAAGFSTGQYWWDGQSLDAFFFGHDIWCEEPDWELVNSQKETYPLIPQEQWHPLFPITQEAR